VPVTLVGDAGETTEVALYPEWAERGPAPFVEHCKLPCNLWIPRGPYRLEIVETLENAGGSRPITIDGPSRLIVTPRDPGQRTRGLVLGIGGIALVAVGIGLMADGVRTVCTGDACASNSRGEAAAGLLVFLAGAVTTPIGWVIFGKSSHPGVDVEHRGTDTTPHASVGVVPLHRGAGLGGSFVF
jgi:hypothetical protein